MRIYDKLKQILKKEVYLSCQNYTFWNELIMSKEDHMALEGLCSNKNIKVQKANKGNLEVLVNKADYVYRMEELLSDAGKFKEVNVEPAKEINILLQHESILINSLKTLKVLLLWIYLRIYIPRTPNQVLCADFIRSINL